MFDKEVLSRKRKKKKDMWVFESGSTSASALLETSVPPCSAVALASLVFSYLVTSDMKAWSLQ